jgi:GTP cyclohydrolase I
VRGEGRAVREAVRRLLRAVGEDPDRPGLREAPERVWEALPELWGGVGKDPGAALTVLEGGGQAEVRLRHLPFLSWCEHHLIPFYGEAEIAYAPAGGRVAGLGDLAGALWILSRRPQIQERLTDQLAEVVWARLAPQWVEVELRAVQLCLVARGARAAGAEVVTRSRRPLP